MRLLLAVSLALLTVAPTAVRATSLPVSNPATEQAAGDIEVYFRNNKGWFKTITLILYTPGARQGELMTKLLLPWQRFSLEVPTGTKIYIADDQQVRRFTEGVDLRRLPPAMTIRESDAGELYNLFR